MAMTVRLPRTVGGDQHRSSSWPRFLHALDWSSGEAAAGQADQPVEPGLDRRDGVLVVGLRAGRAEPVCTCFAAELFDGRVLILPLGGQRLRVPT